MFSLSRCILSFVVFVCCLFSVTAVNGQGRPEISRPIEDDRSVLGSIRGRVLLPGGNFVSTNAKVTLLTLRDTIAIIFTDSQGQFDFQDLIPGNYRIEVDPTDREQFDVSTEPVQVFKGMPSVVTLTLKPHQSAKKVGPTGTVSVTEFGRNVPANARKEFEKASKASQKGMADAAIAHLRKAIEIYPGFVMAHNDLGVQLLAQGKLDEAAQELRTAINLDGKAFNPILNLGIVLVQQHRFGEAATVLGKSLSIEPNSPAARLYSGIASMAIGSFESAEKDLKIAYQIGGAQYALALFHLGQLYMDQGNRQLALQSFERYLSDVPRAVNVDQVRKLIAMLQ